MAYVVTVSQERRDMISRAMQNAPLELPYADYDKWRSIPRLEDRYDAAMLVLPEERLEELGLDRDHMPEQILCRYQAAKYAAGTIRERGLVFRSVADDLGLNMSTFTHYFKGERPINLDFPCFTTLCYAVLHESAHKVMFGEEGKVVLPGFYSKLVKTFLELDSEQQKQIAARAAVLEDYVGSDDSEEGVKALIRERCGMLLDAKGVGIEDFFGERMPLRLRHALMGIFEQHKAYSPQLSSAVYLALESGYALDYFIVRDFTAHIRCFFQDGDKEIEIKDRNALRFVGAMFTVDKEARAKIAAPVIAQMLK